MLFRERYSAAPRHGPRRSVQLHHRSRGGGGQRPLQLRGRQHPRRDGARGEPRGQHGGEAGPRPRAAAAPGAGPALIVGTGDRTSVVFYPSRQ